MNDNYPESFETHTLPGPEAPNLSAPTLAWKSLITPIGTFVLGTVLALGHHVFNALENGKIVAESAVPQHWATRIGVGFSFGFTFAIGVTMVFFLLHFHWLSVVRQPLPIKHIDTIYRIERQDRLCKTLPHALFFSPTIVVFSALTLFLPLSGVFAPGSLTVTTNNYTDIVSPCKIPTGNLSAWDTVDYTTLFIADTWGQWNGAAPKTKALTSRWLVEQHIPDLPQACGLNCRYNVSVLSFVFQCTPNPPSLPYDQTGDPALSTVTTLWNGTIDPNSRWGFYVAWKSTGPNGTSGNGSCSPFQAQYNVEVQMKGGIQSVTTTITQMISPIPDTTGLRLTGSSDDTAMVYMQLAAISHATRALFLGQAFLDYTLSQGAVVTDNRPVSQPSFLETRAVQFIWGDVLKGIEEMSHNVTAALLTLNLGMMKTECFVDQQAVVYQYSSFVLWAPYGITLGVALISLIAAVMIMARNNTGHITTYFSDIAISTRNVDEDVPAGAKLRLRAERDGKLEYTLE